MLHFHLDELEVKEIFPGLKGRFAHSQSMTLSYWNLSAGAVLPEHSHPHEQVTNVLEGKFLLTVGGETKELGPGDIVVIESNAVHSGKALVDSVVMDIFHPVREDYR
jgi:quercetin dioxygenase-like cupin family protein